MKSCLIAVLIGLTLAPYLNSQEQKPVKFTEAERLRGSITPEREWWDLKHYELTVNVFPEAQSIRGNNKIRFQALKEGQTIQIDLQPPLQVSHVRSQDQDLEFTREGNVIFATFPQAIPKGQIKTIEVGYQGKPKVARRPPWDGGVTWTLDERGKTFIATSCQGLGASVWWPCKDHGYDEPDEGMDIILNVPKDLVAVSNGRLIDRDTADDPNRSIFHWRVTQPINNYGVNMNIGNYVHFSEVFDGEGGKLDVDYWVLEHQREIAMKWFKEVPRTLKAFEHWFGKYPFYEDSYKLVVVPYLGMEHQSSVTYGNGFQNGYRGRDLSSTGVGLKFDFIIVHESGHEWWGNNISMKDTADMWIHESFTNYSENLFVEYHFTQKEAQDYVIGCRENVSNNKPIIAEYGLNRSGSGDMYYKGGNMLHMIRQIIADDEKWRQILRGLNQEFWHQTVTTQQIENYISEQAKFDFTKVFDQYLRDTRIPVFSYQIKDDLIEYQFEETVDGFSIPLKITINGDPITVYPSEAKKRIRWSSPISEVTVDRNYYVESKSR
ncbi:MAG: M1 family metallopeptidase [Planctomycetota bacterium]